NFGLAQRRAPLVPFVQHRTRHWPPDRYLRIVPEQYAFVLQRVVVGGLVLHVRNLGNHDKAVREPRWNPGYLFEATLQVRAHPSAESFGAFSQINRYIPDLAERHMNQLSLRPTDLVVETAQDVLRRARMVVLYEFDIDRRYFPKRLAVVGFQE